MHLLIDSPNLKCVGGQGVIKSARTTCSFSPAAPCELNVLSYLTLIDARTPRLEVGFGDGVGNVGMPIYCMQYVSMIDTYCIQNV